MAAHVLVVEDSATQAESLRLLLEEHGYTVTVASSGEQALKAVAKEAFDLVVSDITMPGISGYELCRRIKSDKKRHEVPVVLLSSLSDPLDIVHGLEAGADNYVAKPYEPDHLLMRIRQVLDNRKHRRGSRSRVGVHVSVLGSEFTITSEKEQILDLLISTFEDAVQQNRQLRRREEELESARAELARYAGRLEQRLQSVLEAVPDVVFSVSTDLRTLYYISPACTSVLGLTPEECAADPGRWRAVIHPDDRSRVVGEFERSAKAGRQASAEYRIVRADGSVRWIDETIVPVRENGGVVTRIDGIARDVTDRKGAEENLRASESRLKSVVETALDAVITMDGGGFITGWNQRAEAVFGWPASEAVGRRLAQTIIPPQHREAHERGLTHFLATGHGPVLNRRIELTGLHRDGHEFPVELAISPVRQGDTWLFSAFVRDITEQRKLEAQFRQAQKMEAVGRLAGGVAHDFNNLLTVITSYTDLLLDDLAPQDPRRADIEEIGKAAGSAAALTRQLLAFSRQQVLEPRALDLNAVVSGADTLLKRLLGEDIEVVTVLAPALGTVKADPGQIEQVIVNLAVNARDAMPEGGKLTIETANLVMDEAYVREHPAAQPGPYVLLAVSDTGTGMDEQTQRRIFEPFFTTKEMGKGTGLGLATVYGIVKQSGGFIWVYSEPHHGTSFKIYLPLVEEAAAVATAANQSKQAPRGTETVLLVEDAAAVRAVTRQVLERLGYTVMEAPDGKAALHLAEKHRGPIHLLLTDVVMPELGGRLLAEQLRAARPEVKVLYISGYTDDAVVRHGVLAAGIAYLQKPFTPDVLGRKLREVLDATGES
jgi:PAS domain S-box-containing protein